MLPITNIDIFWPISPIPRMRSDYSGDFGRDGDVCEEKERRLAHVSVKNVRASEG